MIKNEMRFISRNERMGGWRVYVARKKKTIFHKYFLDVEHSNSLHSAKRYRDKIEDYIESLSKSIFSGRKTPPFFRVARPNNKTQIVGVTKRVSKSGNAHWIARWNDSPFNSYRLSFSVNEYGEQKAKELAIAARIEGITQRFEREHIRVFIPRPNFDPTPIQKVKRVIKKIKLSY